MTGQTLAPATEPRNLYGITPWEYIAEMSAYGPGCISWFVRRRAEGDYPADAHLGGVFDSPGVCGGCPHECTAGGSVRGIGDGEFCYGGDWCHDPKHHPVAGQAERFELFHIAYPNVYAHFLAGARSHHNAGFTEVPAGALLRRSAPSVPREYALYFAALAWADDANLQGAFFDADDAQGADRNELAAWISHQIGHRETWHYGARRPDSPIWHGI